VTEPETLTLGPNGWVPNNPALPVLMYRGVVPKGDPDAIEATVRGNGWRPDWRDGVYPYHHYHSSAHEALACVDGSADVMLGGEDGHVMPIAAGDRLVVPTSTATPVPANDISATGAGSVSLVPPAWAGRTLVMFDSIAAGEHSL
jgi:uncharacterized protein YjlB